MNISIYLSIYKCINVSIYLYLSINLSVSIYLSYLSNALSFILSIYLCQHQSTQMGNGWMSVINYCKNSSTARQWLIRGRYCVRGIVFSDLAGRDNYCLMTYKAESQRLSLITLGREGAGQWLFTDISDARKSSVRLFFLFGDFQNVLSTLFWNRKQLISSIYS